MVTNASYMDRCPMRCLTVSGRSYTSKYRIGFALYSLRSVTPRLVDVFSRIHRGRQTLSVYVPTLGETELIQKISFGRPQIVGVIAAYRARFRIAHDDFHDLLYDIAVCPVHVVCVTNEIRNLISHILHPPCLFSACSKNRQSLLFKSFM